MAASRKNQRKTRKRHKAPASSKASSSPRRFYFATIVFLFLSILFGAVLVSVGSILLTLDRSANPFSDDTSYVALTVASVSLSIPRNYLEEPTLDATSAIERVDLHFHWPTGSGYQRALRDAFNSSGYHSNIVHLHLAASGADSQQVTPRRKFEQIYRRYLDTPLTDAPAGISGWTTQAGSPYAGEVILVEDAMDPESASPFVARCLRTNPSADRERICQREIALPDSLLATYRFSHALIGDWSRIDAKAKELMLRFSAGRLDPDQVARQRRQWGVEDTP